MSSTTETPTTEPSTDNMHAVHVMETGWQLGMPGLPFYDAEPGRITNYALVSDPENWTPERDEQGHIYTYTALVSVEPSSQG